MDIIIKETDVIRHSQNINTKGVVIGITTFNNGIISFTPQLTIKELIELRNKIDTYLFNKLK